MNEGEGLAEVVKVNRMCNIPWPWLSGWLVCFGLEIKASSWTSKYSVPLPVEEASPGGCSVVGRLITSVSESVLSGSSGARE